MCTRNDRVDVDYSKKHKTFPPPRSTSAPEIVAVQVHLWKCLQKVGKPDKVAFVRRSQASNVCGTPEPTHKPGESVHELLLSCHWPMKRCDPSVGYEATGKGIRLQQQSI
jgi:hypothetical protein